MGRKNPWSDLVKILHWDIITYANFDDNQLCGFSVERGQILSFSIGFRHCPYNTLALPCECVITGQRKQMCLKQVLESGWCQTLLNLCLFYVVLIS